ncbi:MAG TPA: hypothetical protein VMP03_02735, partial [Methylomirabilota bacterium]|nr:hypothetical protein [Methylomirabilota bacterium]
SGYTLEWKGERTGPAPIDGSVFRPDVLCALEPAAVAAQTIRVGRTHVPLGGRFRIVPHDYHGQIALDGAPPLDRLGASMRSGELMILGDAGDDLGASMRGGVIRVTGSAGHRVGGPDAASDRGMTGGEIFVEEHAGDFVGLRMRRGLIAVHKSAGRSPGYRMLAGTVFVGDGPLDAPGLEMRRGTILAPRLGAPWQPPPHLADEGVFNAREFPVIQLLFRRLKQAVGWEFHASMLQGMYQLFSGDRFELGRGEVWQWVS